jgi:hypothetical protein
MNRKTIIECAIALVLAALLIWAGQGAGTVDMQAREIAVELAEPNLTRLEEELDELRWEVDAQQSVAEQIGRMAKER